MGSAMEEGSPIYFVNIGRRDGDDVRIGDRLFTHVVLQYFYEGEVEVQGEGGVDGGLGWKSSTTGL